MTCPARSKRFEHPERLARPAARIVARRDPTQAPGISGGFLVRWARHVFLGVSSWPPNSKRIAESNRLAYSSSSRDENRPYRAALRTGAGTDSSIAAESVHRPS